MKIIFSLIRRFLLIFLSHGVPLKRKGWPEPKQKHMAVWIYTSTFSLYALCVISVIFPWYALHWGLKFVIFLVIYICIDFLISKNMEEIKSVAQNRIENKFKTVEVFFFFGLVVLSVALYFYLNPINS